MPGDDSLPSLRRLTADVTGAMYTRERQAARRRRTLRHATAAAAAVGVLSVPAALGVQSVLAPDPIAGLPEGPVPAGLERQESGPPVYVARGRVAGVEWGLTARPCEYGGVTTVATALVLSDGSAGANPCPLIDPQRGPAEMPILLPELSYAGGIGRTFITGVVPSRVASVELHIERHPARTRGRSVNPDVVRVPTRPLLAGARLEGGLPDGLRTFVYVARGDLTYTRAVARTASGDVLLDCLRRECDRLGRGAPG